MKLQKQKLIGIVVASLALSPTNGVVFAEELLDEQSILVNADGEIKSNVSTSASIRVEWPEADSQNKISAKYITNNQGSTIPSNLQVPVLAYDENNIVLVWEKPENYANIVDYHIYMNGQFIGSAEDNFKENYQWTAAYRDAFYEKTEEDFHVKTDIHVFRATNLEADTMYEFTVRAVLADGSESADSNIIMQKTAAQMEEFNILDYGATDYGRITTYNDEINEKIIENTKAIQSAIDACSKGGKVVVPEGTYVAGALFLKSDMTLELQEGAVLMASPNVDHYDKNYILYPYSTDTRSWAFINAYTEDRGELKNIRITGTGTIDGNGWNYKDGSTNGSSDKVSYQSLNKLDPTDEEYRLKIYMGGNKDKVKNYGILAADAWQKGVNAGQESSAAYGTRPNLVVIRGAENVYVENITLENPANHGLAILDCKDVVANGMKNISYDCNNGDGIELGNTQNAIVVGNFFDTGDDSINFATGLGMGVKDSEQVPTQNVWTFNNFIRNGHGGAIAAGSHTGAGICDMLVEDNVINLSEMPFRFKSAPVNGGGVWDVMVRDCAVENSKQLVTFSTTYGDANQVIQIEANPEPAEFRDITFYNITANEQSKNTIEIKADVVPASGKEYKTPHTHHDIYFKDIMMKGVNSTADIQGAKDVIFDNVQFIDGKSSSAPWKTILYSEGLEFINGTTTDAVSKDAEEAPVWDTTQNIAINVEGNNTQYTIDIDWEDVEGATTYVVETYVNDEMVDTTERFSSLTIPSTYSATNLYSDVEYRFKIYAKDATGNKVEGPTIIAPRIEKTSGNTVQEIIEGIEGVDVTTNSALQIELEEIAENNIEEPNSLVVEVGETGYTWTNLELETVKAPEIRGYRFYVNGELVKTYYKYQISGEPETIALQVGRLTPGMENEIVVKAFTDQGEVITYNTAYATTWGNYDFDAPDWGTDAKLEAKVVGEDVILSWSEATDTTQILGYRVYVDGKAVVTKEGDVFNSVNDKYTTKELSYTISGLDLSVAHEFKVEAGDVWWKSAEGKAPIHWTLSGPTAVLEAQNTGGDITVPNYIFKDDFNTEGDTIEKLGYTVTEKEKSGGTAGIQGEVSIAKVNDKGDYALFVNDTGDDSFIINKSVKTDEKILTTSIDFMQTSKVTNGITPIKLYDASRKVVAILEINEKEFKYRQADTKDAEGKTVKNYVSSGVAVEADTWYNIKLVTDLETKTHTLYIDGEETAVKDEGFVNGGATGIAKYEAFSAGSSAGSFYLDNIAVYEGSYTANDTDKVEQEKPPVTEPGTGSVANSSLYEAEDAEFDPEWVKVDNKHVGFTGTGFIDYAPNQTGGVVIFTVNVEEAGEYVLDIRYAHGSDDDRPVAVKVNDVTVAAKHSFEPTGAFTNYQNSRLTAQLKAGENKISLTAVGASGGPNIDSLMVYPSYEVTLQAEDNLVSEGIEFANNNAGFTGSGFLDYKPNVAGGYAEWTVEIPYETSYVLNFRYANGGSLSRPLEIKVNDTVFADSMAFESTGDWTTWNNTSTTVVLKKGTNVIRATAVGAEGGPNLDAFTIQTADVAAESDGSFLPDDFEAVPVEDILGKATMQILSDKGVIAKNPGAVTTYPVVSGDYVEMKKVDTYGSNIILITLDGRMDQFNFSDIKLGAYSSEWYSLNAKFEDKITIKRAGQTLNEQGETVLVYEINEELDGNRLVSEVEPVQFTDINAAIEKADNYVSWQMDHGGWDKGLDLHGSRPWNGTEPKNLSSGWKGVNGEELGTIDNDATYSHIIYLAQVYQATGNEKYKESIEKGLDFIANLQYESGGFAQVYPKRGNYSDYVTFNDEAMINVLIMLQDVQNEVYPFNNGVVSEEYRSKVEGMIDKAIDYILKAQIVSQGELTAWCAQHDPVTYEPRGARAYEHPSISGSESVAVVKFLMNQEQTPEIREAVEAAISWFKESEVKGVRFDKNDPNGEYFISDPNSSLWYRFYEIGTNRGIFSGRDGIIKYDIREIEEERRLGYSWSGVWPRKLIEIYDSVGYFPNLVQAKVVADTSQDAQGKTLKIDSVIESEDDNLAEDITEINMTVSKDGIGDYETVQAAINAVPSNSDITTNIYIKEGVYKEVVTIAKDKGNINLIGDGQGKTIITYDNFSGRDNELGGTFGTSGSASVFINGNDIGVKGITFENSFDEASSDVNNKQAVAVNIIGERVAFIDCGFIGNQDTLYVRDGSQYFKDCYIEGDVDFIFGAAQAVFEDCTIFSYNRGSKTNNGYVTAASTQDSDEYGFLFKNCKLIADENMTPGTVHLGRPWHPSSSKNVKSSTAFVNCELGAHINEEGWTSMSGVQPETERYYEYHNTGAGAIINEKRPQLTDEEAAEWTTINVLKGWNPESILEQLPDSGEKPDSEDKPDSGDSSDDDDDQSYTQTPSTSGSSQTNTTVITKITTAQLDKLISTATTNKEVDITLEAKVSKGEVTPIVLSEQVVERLIASELKVVEFTFGDIVVTIPVDTIAMIQGEKVVVQAEAKNNSYAVNILAGDTVEKAVPVYKLAENIVIAVPYKADKSQATNILTAFRVAEGGTKTNVGGYYADGTYKIVTDTLGKFVIEENRVNFIDVTKEDTGYSAITSLAAKGYINGIEKNIFEPNKSMTRAEFTNLLAQVLHLRGQAGKSEFKDVKVDAWYTEGINACTKAGLIKGVGKDKFVPTGEISRQDMFVMLSRAIDLLGIGAEQVEEVTLTDMQEQTISPYAQEAVKKCLATGIMTNQDLNNAKKASTRREMAIYLDKILNLSLQK